MKKLPFVFFCFILLMAVFSSMCGYRDAKQLLQSDADNALALTLCEMRTSVVDADTIMNYRSHLQFAELKDTAGLSVKVVSRNGRMETLIVAEANCNFFTVLKRSNQKTSGLLLILAAVWYAAFYYYRRRRAEGVCVAAPISVAQSVGYGGLVYANGRFATAQGQPLHLTPMQQTLMQLLMDADGHVLSKSDICRHLWPKKPDADDTLYTLVRRTKRIVEPCCQVRIKSDRGRGYSLEISQME